MAAALVSLNARCAAVLPLIVSLAAGGCQRTDKVTVSGRIVRQDGTPLKSATVIARSNETGKWATGTTDADGRYELGTANAGDGIPPGDYHVVIMEDLGDSGQRPPTIPAKYGSQTTSKLQLTVGGGRKVVFDITLDRT
jgi:hypothetical protein